MAARVLSMVVTEGLGKLCILVRSPRLLGTGLHLSVCTSDVPWPGTQGRKIHPPQKRYMCCWTMRKECGCAYELFLALAFSCGHNSLPGSMYVGETEVWGRQKVVAKILYHTGG
ncbi:unnamed protein product [Ectocarpus sp. 12 AP-2014]